MTQPLALIEGDLAFPKPRPFDGLPPPFGSRRRAARVVEQREPPLAAQTAAQQAIQDAVQRKSQPARTGSFPPGVKHVLSWSTRPQRSNPYSFDAELTEAKRYLEMGKARPRSSRSDHMLAASIFAGCTIALTWLLVTCSMKDAEKAKAVSVAPPILSAAPSVDHPKPVATTAVADTQTAATEEKGPQQSVAAAASVVPAKANAQSMVSSSQVRPTAVQASVESKEIEQAAQAVPITPLSPKAALTSPAAPKHITQVVPRRPVQAASHADDMITPPAKAPKRVKVARLSEAQVNERVALSRTVRPATQPSVSKQPEWTARPSAEGDTFDKAALLNWAAQQRARVTTRATVPVPGDTDWNARMTQRRITDNPDAFQTDRSQK